VGKERDSLRVARASRCGVLPSCAGSVVGRGDHARRLRSSDLGDLGQRLPLVDAVGTISTALSGWYHPVEGLRFSIGTRSMSARDDRGFPSCADVRRTSSLLQHPGGVSLTRTRCDDGELRVEVFLAMFEFTMRSASRPSAQFGFSSVPRRLEVIRSVAPGRCSGGCREVASGDVRCFGVPSAPGSRRCAMPDSPYPSCREPTR
jgi:hypothetical protein